MRNEYEDMHRSFALETEMVNKELAAALETLITHKLHVQQTLKRIDERPFECAASERELSTALLCASASAGDTRKRRCQILRKAH